MLPAVVTVAWPSGGWQALFLVGGAIPLLAALLNWLWMPESLKFLALKAADAARLLGLVRRLRPELDIAADAIFTFPQRGGGAFRITRLFESDLRLMTPLVWVLFMANLMANFFLNSWMPTLLRDSGLSASAAALTNSLYYVGGVIGGLSIGCALDRAGIAIIAGFMLAGCICVAVLGQVSTMPGALQAAVFMVGVTVLGVQLGLNAVAGLTYPTAIRANGTGWALGIGRIGAILGPLIGGQLIHMHLPINQLMLAPAVPLFIGAAAAFLLRPMARSRWAGNPDEMPH